MIRNIGLFLEILSVVFCLHCLYGKKFKLDIITTSFLALYMIAMAALNYYGLPQIFSILIYPFIVIYCGIRFGWKWRALIINNVLYIVIIGVIQLIVAIGYGFILNTFAIHELTFNKEELPLLNGCVLFLILIILPKLRLCRLSIYLQDKEKILQIVLIFCIALTLYGVVNYKMSAGLKGYQNLVLFIGISMFCILAGQLGKYKIKSKEIEIELKMHKLFEDSFHGLIEDIRLRQHEFDNHISTLYSLHYTCKSFEELVNAQNEYSQAVIKENQYNKLLRAGNPLLIGFLYGKFVEMEKLGVVITYQINIEDLNVNIPVYKLVEILGNLIKNAMEALCVSETTKSLHICVIETDGNFEIEVRNRSRVIDYNEIQLFFMKNFSKKGKGRGLGLYNVKRICNEYALNIFCENKTIGGENWLSFSINNKKEAM